MFILRWFHYLQHKGHVNWDCSAVPSIPFPGLFHRENYVVLAHWAEPMNCLVASLYSLLEYWLDLCSKKQIKAQSSVTTVPTQFLSFSDKSFITTSTWQCNMVQYVINLTGTCSLNKCNYFTRSKCNQE